MALNQVSIVQPRQAAAPERQQPEKTTMEKILEGLQIANGVLSIGSNIQTIRAKQGDIEAQDAVNNGVLTKDQEINVRSKFDQGSEGDPGSFLIGKVRGQDGEESPLIMRAKTDPKAAGRTQVLGNSLYQEGPDGWREVAAGKATPKTREIETIENGKVVRKIVPDEVGASYIKPPAEMSPGETQRIALERERLGIEKGKIAEKQNPNFAQRLKGLSGEERKRLDSASMGLESVQQMDEALKNGDNTFSVIGDNNFTTAQRNFEESIGRMQSGGAISNDEASRFRKMAPGPFDSAEMKAQKLNGLQAEMALRIKNLGFEPKEIMAQRSAAEGAPMETGGGGYGEAFAAPKAPAGVSKSDVEKELIRRGVIKPK